MVDRFLEHARVFVFHNSGKPTILLSSADWMVRNLSFRVETAFPIYDTNVRRQVLDMLDIQWSDNVKARILDAKMKNEYQKDGQELAIQSQVETYFYFKRREEI
ncbi:MAG: polyphosphate kinase [Saprospiraceae bacterium]